MTYPLEFEKLLSYDVGAPGITLLAGLKLKAWKFRSRLIPVRVALSSSVALANNLALTSKAE